MRHYAICLVLLACLGACSAELEPSAFTVDSASGALAAASCEDPNPPPPPEPDCLFGEVFSDVRRNPALAITSEVWIRTVEGLDELTALQLLHAVHQSTYTDTTTPAEALARVDQQEIRRIDFHELTSGRRFIVLEYGAGDNSYGAYFDPNSAEVLAAIHDGDILDCHVPLLD